MLLSNLAHYSFFRVVRFDEIMSQRTGEECKNKWWINIKEQQNSLMTLCVLLHGTQWFKLVNQKGMLLFSEWPPVLWVVRRMYCTLRLAAKHRHVILHCICLVKLIEHMLIWVQLKWSGAYQIQCPIHLVSISVLTFVRIKALNK